MRPLVSGVPSMQPLMLSLRCPSRLITSAGEVPAAPPKYTPSTFYRTTIGDVLFRRLTRSQVTNTTVPSLIPHPSSALRDNFGQLKERRKILFEDPLVKRAAKDSVDRITWAYTVPNLLQLSNRLLGKALAAKVDSIALDVSLAATSASPMEHFEERIHVLLNSNELRQLRHGQEAFSSEVRGCLENLLDGVHDPSNTQAHVVAFVDLFRRFGVPAKPCRRCEPLNRSDKTKDVWGSAAERLTLLLDEALLELESRTANFVKLGESVSRRELAEFNKQMDTFHTSVKWLGVEWVSPKEGGDLLEVLSSVITAQDSLRNDSRISMLASNKSVQSNLLEGTSLNQ